jgi:hypothetical protein
MQFHFAHSPEGAKLARTTQGLSFSILFQLLLALLLWGFLIPSERKVSKALKRCETDRAKRSKTPNDHNVEAFG